MTSYSLHKNPPLFLWAPLQAYTFARSIMLLIKDPQCQSKKLLEEREASWNLLEIDQCVYEISHVLINLFAALEAVEHVKIVFTARIVISMATLASILVYVIGTSLLNPKSRFLGKLGLMIDDSEKPHYKAFIVRLMGSLVLFQLFEDSLQMKWHCIPIVLSNLWFGNELYYLKSFSS